MSAASRSRFVFEIGPPIPDERHLYGMRQVDIWAANRWVTCDDNTVFIPAFVPHLDGAIDRLLSDLDSPRPFPNLSPADNHRRLLSEARAENKALHFRHLFLNWGPTTDNVIAHIFREGGRATIPFSFWREDHHDCSELGQVFVTELPTNELIAVLLEATRALVWNRPSHWGL
jgi:hypothetical protein